MKHWVSAARWVIAATLVIGWTTNVWAEALTGDPQAGAAKAAVCGACHGLTGNSVNPQWPNLAAQHHQYIESQLHFLKTGARVAALMNPMAANLSDQDMADLAAYFEKQKPVGLEANPQDLELGKKLYRAGDAARGIPACSACHGPDGRGNGQAKWPQIRAQHADYVVNQLINYAEQKRYNEVTTQAGQGAMMVTIAKRMTAQDMAAVANYIQGLR
jgi:cytochrome c553